MPRISNIKPGQVLWSLSRRQMGNTTMRTLSAHRITVTEVHEVHEDHVIGHGGRRYSAREVSRWKVNEPITVNSLTGRTRLATPEEKKAILAERKRKAEERMES